MASAIFKHRPAWLKSRNTSSPSSPPTLPKAEEQANGPTKKTSDLDMFSRSNATSMSFKEERERKKRERKLAKHKERRCKRSSSGSDDSQSSKDDAFRKRTRKRSKSASSSPKPVKLKHVKSESKSQKRLNGNRKSAELESPVKQSIEVDGFDDDLKKPHNPSFSKSLHTQPKTDNITLSDDDDDSVEAVNSDEEFERLARRAEARKRSQQSGGASVLSPGQSLHSNNDTGTADPPSQTGRTATLSPANANEPIINILVHSTLPNTKPVFFKVLLSQKLKLVKQNWCKKWDLPDEAARDVYLMWRGFKVFETTSCKGLGVKVDSATGEVTWRGRGLVDIEGSANLEMEAWTPELAAQEAKRKKEEEEAEKRRTDAAQDGGDAKDGEHKKKEGGIRIIMKSKEYGEERLTVYKDTTFKRIAGAFRKIKKLPTDQDVFVMLDGERKEDDETAGDADIADLDCVEVHVR